MPSETRHRAVLLPFCSITLLAAIACTAISEAAERVHAPPQADAAPIVSTARQQSLFQLRSARKQALVGLSSDTVLVIYFGYAACWRYCPTALNNIAAAVESASLRGKRVQPVFVDLDPSRTTGEQLAHYMRAFGSSFVALTGTPPEIQRVAEAFGVTLQKLPFSEDPMDYAMAHSSPIIIWNPQSGSPAKIPASSETSEIAAAIKHAVEAGRWP